MIITAKILQGEGKKLIVLPDKDIGRYLDQKHPARVEIRIGDAALLEGEAPFDVILANINRNILLEDMAHYVGHLNVNGLLIMSGFYQQDLPLIRQRAEELGLVLLQEKEENKWTAACFYKKETCC